MKRAAMGLVVLLLTLGVMVPAGAVGRGPKPTPGVVLNLHIAARHTLCHEGFADRVASVTVTRSKFWNPEHFTFPARMRVAKPALVRALAMVLCSLPVMPVGVQACPVDWGANYALQFSLSKPRGPIVVEGAYLSPVSLGATGCEVVTGLGRTRWAMGTPKLFSTLGVAIGLRHATQATFAGVLAG